MMISLRITRLCALFVTSCLFQHSANAGTFQTLKTGDQDQIKKGQSIVIYTNVEHDIWPRATVYQRAQASPEECAAVLSDYDQQKEYLSGIKSAIAHPSTTPHVTEVEYQMDIPYMFQWVIKPSYRAKEELSYDKQEKTYKISWSQIEGESFDQITGFVNFEPLDDGSTFIEYSNLATPHTQTGIIASDSVVTDFKKVAPDAVQSLVTRVETLKNHDVPTLKKELDALRSSTQDLM